ncbi:MAG: hypothetical protein A3H91_00025 [Gammaproteobacteria bacterium RIFCSPLOWO2_02_FULL_61_13]|nr:MAG: hypothetical protein A3H91_00025 [Gammaproteobacteria bacterium RIFCSPLOWO2_02_FULL_61_13]
MNTLSYNTNTLAASAPSAGLWRRAANLYWTGWSQYAASMNNDVTLRPSLPVWSRQVADEDPAVGYGAARLNHPTAGASEQRLVDHAA